MAEVRTVDTHYLGYPRFAACFLLLEGGRAAFVETNTNFAVPKLLEALRASGRAPEDVDYVIVTHVHLDHAGGASKLMAVCPNATLLAHPRAAKHLIDPAKLVASAEQVYGVERFAALYGSIEPIAAARVRTMGDEETLRWGETTLRFLHTRGHANHHFCVLDEAARNIFTGDSFGLRYPTLQDEGLVVFPSTSPTDFDPVAARESVRRIAASGAARAYLTHYGECDALDAAADSLCGQLDAYEVVVEEADASGREGEELATFVRAGVEAIFAEAFGDRAFMREEARRAVVAMDVDLNAQGVAFAVEKRRHKRATA